MEIITRLKAGKITPAGSVLAIGNFDGVHIGHQAIIRQARALADENELPLVVMTFHPAPVKVLRPELAPRILTPIEVKQRILEERGIDTLIIVPTDKAFLAQEPDDFVREIVVGRLAARHVVEGGTFGFGRRRAGSMESLEVLGQRYGFTTHQTASQTREIEGFADPVAVSSTFIRQQIGECEFAQVRQCLGRFYELPGQVGPAKGRGHKIGFPTANLRLFSDDQLVPPDGVYAGYVRLGDDLDTACQSEDYLPAAISIGECETFVDGQWQIEAHLLDFEANRDALYEKHMLIALVARIRQQEKFDSAEALVTAIGNDCQQVRLTLLDDHNQPDEFGHPPLNKPDPLA